MRNTWLFFLNHFLFWIFFFIFFRILFLTSLYPFQFDVNTQDFLYSLVAGIRLDISIAAYVFIIPSMLLLLSIIGFNRHIEQVFKWYYRIIIMLLIFLCLSNIIIFKYWGTLLNNRALAYASQPSEMIASVNNITLMIILITVVAIFILFIKFFNASVLHSFQKINVTRSNGILTVGIILPLTLIGIRGGIQLIPVNESVAVFSSTHSLNQAAINPIWYLGHNLHQSGITEKNPFVWFEPNEAKDITENILRKSKLDTASVFLHHTKPNVVIILLESWTADIIEPLGGLKGVTPEFTRLASEGLLFTSIYSSGFRTDQALVSVLSGFPSQPNKSIIRFPGKVARLPSLASEFKKLGYHNSFYYGGELGFANMNNYLINSGVDKIISIKNFPSGRRTSKWGVHDEFLFEKHLTDLTKSKQPFFSTLLTLSTHEPFDVPMKTPFTENSEAEQFKKSAWYTDYCLGEYFRIIKNTDWYSNTIFILLADHGHRLPLKRNYYDIRVRQIPVLMVSDLLKDEKKGTTVSTLANQHDVAATLLTNLGISDKEFVWSVNIMDPERYNFAYLSLDVAITWSEQNRKVLVPLQPVVDHHHANESLQTSPKAYLQHLYQTFLDY